VDAFDGWHVMKGQPAIKGCGVPSLADDPALWADVWRQSRAELLPAWIARAPGSRPPAWHRFDAGNLPEREELENEVEWLHRCRLIGPEELDAIRVKGKSLANYNRGRRGGGPNANYIPPDDIHIFAIEHGLLTEEEAAILGD
jgi:hypothetical protein